MSAACQLIVCFVDGYTSYTYQSLLQTVITGSVLFRLFWRDTYHTSPARFTIIGQFSELSPSRLTWNLKLKKKKKVIYPKSDLARQELWTSYWSSNTTSTVIWLFKFPKRVCRSLSGAPPYLYDQGICFWHFLLISFPPPPLLADNLKERSLGITKVSYHFFSRNSSTYGAKPYRLAILCLSLSFCNW